MLDTFLGPCRPPLVTSVPPRPPAARPHDSAALTGRQGRREVGVGGPGAFPRVGEQTGPEAGAGEERLCRLHQSPERDGQPKAVVAPTGHALFTHEFRDRLAA